MADIDGGYVCVARKIQQSEVWKRPPECLKIWIYLLQEVNHGDRRAFPRGTNYFNYEDIARSCLLKYSTVDNWMRWLKSTGHITARKTTRGTVVTVLNYDKYQQSKSYDYGTDYGTVYETEAEHLRNTTGTINKNEKNGRTKETVLPATADSDSRDVNLVMEKFQMLINPVVQYGNRSQREAASDLIRKCGGVEKVLRAVEYAASLKDERFAPVITTPYQLREKFAQLMQHYSKKAAKPDNVTSI